MAKNAMTLSRRLLVSAFLLTLVACSQNSTGTTTTPSTGGGGGTTNAKPVATLVQPTAAVNSETGLLLTFKASATDPDASDTIQSFTWDFGDGTLPVTVLTSADLNGTTTHAFTGTQGIDKTFSVSVKATDSRGLASDAASVTITIPAFAGPTAAVTVPAPVGAGAVALNIAPGEPFTFRAGVDPATLHAGVTVKSFVWNFGDGTAPQTVDAVAFPDGAVSHTFATATGSPFSVSVAAISSLNNQGPVSASVAIDVNASNANLPPTVNLTATPVISAGANATYQGVSVAFNATGADPNGDTLTYAWDFGDGTVLAAAPGISPITKNHTYATPGVYVVKVTADDGRVGGSKVVSLTMNVLANGAPNLSVVKTTPAGTLYANAPALFTATTSDPNGDPLTLTWDFGDGTAPASGASVTQSHTYTTAGPTTLTVVADDLKGGKATATLSFTVTANSAPVASLTTVPAGNLFQTKSYAFAASATDPDAGDTIVSYDWDFGDGTPIVTTATGAANHTYATTVTGTRSVRVRATDNRGGVGSYSPAGTVTVVATSLPVSTFVLPASPQTVQAPLGGYSDVAFKVMATCPNAGIGAVNPIALGGIVFSAGDATATIQSSVANGDGTYTYVVRYPAAAATGSRVVSPTASALDSLGIQGVTGTGPAITVQTTGANNAPTITITTPATSSTNAFTRKQVALAFNLFDSDSDPVTYTVNWGDGTTSGPTAISSGTGSGSGATVNLSHAYGDAFTATTASATITVTATDSKSTNATATPQTRTVVVTYNTPGVATISSPQASGNLTGIDTTALGINDGARVVVIPQNGKLSFAGSSTTPASGGVMSLAWTFTGGSPSSAAGSSVTDIVFAGNAGQINAYKVSLVPTDDTGYSTGVTVNPSTGVPSALTHVWVVVDGSNTKSFGLNFLYRTKADNNGNASAAVSTTSGNGLDTPVQIFQDGVNSTWNVNSGGTAQISIPVRGNLPFWVLIPKFGSDTREYLMRIPNAAGQDPSLEAALPNTASRFAFVSGNPTLYLVSGQGFALENASAAQRRLQGTFYAPASYPGPFTNHFYDLLGYSNPNTSRWLDRLSVPLTDSLDPRPSAGTITASYSGVSGYQSFAEWLIAIKSISTKDYFDTDGTAANPSSETLATGSPALKSDLGFVIDYPIFSAQDNPNPGSQSYMATHLQVFRAPAGSTDPYDADTAGGVTSSAYVATTPTKLAVGPSFFNGMVWNGPGGSALAGGVNSLSIPYDANDPNRDPNGPGVPKTYYVDGPVHSTASTFSFAEYLWTSVWARPLVLNRASLNSTASLSIGTYADFHFSNPAGAWPALSGIAPTSSAFDITPAGGSDFTPLSTPVTEGSSTLVATSVGRFYWTALTPHYNAASGALISRTWLSQGTGDANPKQPPVSFTSGTGDATSAFGFVPPQDTVVDKRGRDANGVLTGATLGGYRVTWYNPTKDSSGAVVAPDFWVVELNLGTTNRHFLLPGGFPVGTQAVTDAILTDARTFLPSGAATLQAGDKVAPGYCWFDIPVELRPVVGATLRVYAVKAILKNHAPTGARVLNRTEWVEAVKTATATMKMVTSAGDDITYAHKIPFNYYWDIVVANSPATSIAP